MMDFGHLNLLNFIILNTFTAPPTHRNSPGHQIAKTSAFKDVHSGDHLITLHVAAIEPYGSGEGVLSFTHTASVFWLTVC